MVLQKSHIILSTENLSIGYRNSKQDTVIASHINLSLKSSSLVGLIGINGSGKSTLLRTLAQLQDPLSGTIRVSEKNLTNVAQEQLAQSMSVVLTGQAISKNLSVIELVALGRQPYTNWLGTLGNQDQSIISEALTQTETMALKNRKCYELSDGQLQRVLIARALAQDTPIILLDEPMTHLDLHHKASVLKLLQTIVQEQGKTVIFSTHDIEYALRLCDKLVVMRDGQALVDTPQELVTTGVLDTLFPNDAVQFDRALLRFSFHK